MGKAVIASFEEKAVKILQASLKGNTLRIDKTETVSAEDFDAYLGREKAKEFIVVYNFKEAFHDILTIPSVKTGYIEKIAESEIRKATGLKDFSFIYTLLNERTAEGKKVMDVFYFAVKSEEVRNAVNRFYENGKIVKALYPQPLSVSSLLNEKLYNVDAAWKAVIGVAGSETEKSAFLIRNGKVYFIRGFKSISTEISDIDIQDINMTINYCFQNIRIHPSLVLLAGNLSSSYDIKAQASAPLACLKKAASIHCTEEVFNDFIIPISAFYATNSLNILSREFKNVYMLKNYMVNASMAFIALSALCLGIIGYNLKGISDIEMKIKSAIRDEVEVSPVFSEYTQKRNELEPFMPAINFLNKPRPAIQGLLARLAEIETGSSRITSIDAKTEEGHFIITLKGAFSADNFTSSQKAFQTVAASLEKIENITSKLVIGGGNPDS
ncbi:MAG: hypothetical protein HY756_05380 [Nitrospirae bacterium]|nr:hypothetical protein [Nitrospirota bacterium]